MLGLSEAGHAEYDAQTTVALIAPVACPVADRVTGAPRLTGRLPITLVPGSFAATVYGRLEIEEGFACNYELNPAFQSALTAAGLVISGFGPNGEARLAELTDHPFYLGTLFLPQLAEPRGQHPLIAAFLKAVVRFHRANGRR